MKNLFISLQFSIPVIAFIILFNIPVVVAPEISHASQEESIQSEEEPVKPVSVASPTVKKVSPKKDTKKKIVGVSGNCESWRPLVSKYFPKNQVDNALFVMSKESGCKQTSLSPKNHDGTRDRGLFQVNNVHADKVSGNLDLLFDPETNIRIASGIYLARGNWSAWYAVCTPKKVAKYPKINCR